MIVCLQAEDGIRDANEGREFRRVLVRSGFFGTDRTGGYSDLYLGGALAIHNDTDVFTRNLALEAGVEGPLAELPAGSLSVAFGAEIGSASCRESVCHYVSLPVVAVALQNIRCDPSNVYSTSNINNK